MLWLFPVCTQYHRVSACTPVTGRHWTMVVKDPLLVTAKKLAEGLDLTPGW